MEILYFVSECGIISISTDRQIKICSEYRSCCYRGGMNKMSKYSLNTAIKYGKTLREFSDKSEAEDYFISYKDDLLSRLKVISAQASAFFPDYTVESLKKLEKWYFDLYEKQSFEQVGLTQEEFESMMSVYWGEVIIKNNEDAKWVVMEYPFSQKKYEFLVNKGLCSVSVVNKFHDLYSKQNNKRRTLLFREYNRYFAR